MTAAATTRETPSVPICTVDAHPPVLTVSALGME
jgi:hypothetical protein